ncbi:FAD-dependent monooxygenase [Paracoccaceae bacterium]|nr:FAD-dependent monooxygenase [Paracoccaceae bacterium]
MKKKDCDTIILSGLGISGLIVASLFSKKPIKVEGFEPRDPSLIHNDERTTAFLNPAIAIFKDIGVWDKICPFAQPLKEMEIIDASDVRQQPNLTKIVFDPNDIGLDKFGYNIPNKIVSSILLDYLKKKRNFVLNKNDAIIDHYAFDDYILVKSQKGKQIKGKLLISCEGKTSPSRKREKIKTIQSSYNQMAMVFQIKHTKKHFNRTTEILDKGGPFTIIPLATSSNQKNSTIVWLDTFDQVDKAFSLNKIEFETFINKRSLGIRGKIKLNSTIQKWPVVSQFSRDLISKRMVFLAESAHVMPPTGAQGLNTSIEDILSLYKIFEECLKDDLDIGSNNILRKYSLERFPRSGAKVIGIHFLNLISMTDKKPLKMLRRTFLRLLDNQYSMKRLVMKVGLGK